MTKERIDEIRCLIYDNDRNKELLLDITSTEEFVENMEDIWTTSVSEILWEHKICPYCNSREVAHHEEFKFCGVTYKNVYVCPKCKRAQKRYDG